VSGILVQSISEFASIFADTAKSVQDDLAKTLSNTASPMDLNSLGQSQQRAMETALRRCVEMSNRSMKLGQDMLSKISDASTDALSKAKSSS
jgi:predicted Holliday junction resolvase-like endonuclease